jgi:hypothetical protein
MKELAHLEIVVFGYTERAEIKYILFNTGHKSHLYE